jgi:hypothetical protein
MKLTRHAVALPADGQLFERGQMVFQLAIGSLQRLPLSSQLLHDSGNDISDK